MMLTATGVTIFTLSFMCFPFSTYVILDTLPSFQSKVYTRTPTLYLDFRLQAGVQHVQPVPKGKRITSTGNNTFVSIQDKWLMDFHLWSPFLVFLTTQSAFTLLDSFNHHSQTDGRGCYRKK